MYEPTANEDDYNKGWDDALDTIWAKISKLNDPDGLMIFWAIEDERN